MNLTVRLFACSDTCVFKGQMRNLQVILIDDIIYGAALMISHIFSGRIWHVVNRLNIKVLLGVICFVSGTLSVVGTNS